VPIPQGNLSVNNIFTGCSLIAGLSSSAIVASQQASAPSLYPPARRWEW